jgi:replication initiation protein RepC
MDATLIEHQKYATADLPPEGVNKYEVVRELAAARNAIGVTDRELAVLQVLLSFHPKTILGGNSAELVVYPSNAAICERLNGMPCSTMRRHLAGLVSAGLLLRRDSPNGKRYVKRHGDEPQAFGFDLTPLLSRYAEICELAEEARSQAEHLQRLRRTVSLMRRDLAGLAEYGSKTRPELRIWDAYSDQAVLTARSLRRNLTSDELSSLKKSLLISLNAARDSFDLVDTQIMSSSDADNEQHIQNSNKEGYDSEPYIGESKGGVRGSDLDNLSLPNIPLALVVSACQEISLYSPGEIRHWHQLVRVAEKIRPMMGISMSAWDEARSVMGSEEAGVVMCAILERFSEIKSPGGYLRALTRKAEQGGFSCGPMIMALMGSRVA